ncbi:MAG: hypothetical protein WCQ57_11655, partial [Verrucomicrobiota bacterium]
LSKEAHYRSNKRIFGAWDGNYQPTIGTLRALLAGQHCVDVVSEHHLEGKSIDRFPILVVPEWAPLGADFHKHLLGYVRRGGKVLLIGVNPTREFAAELGVQPAGDAVRRQRWLAGPSGLAGIESEGLAFQIKSPAKVSAVWHERRDPLSPAHPLAVTRHLGKGTLAAIAVDFGIAYDTASTFQARDFLAAAVHSLFPEPVVTVSGSHQIDVSLMRKHGDLFMHLVNTAGAHADMGVSTHDEIPPLHDIEIRLRLPRRPAKIVQQPAGKALPFRWSKGTAALRVPVLEIHEILQIQIL